MTKDHIYCEHPNTYKLALFIESVDHDNYTEYVKGKFDPRRCGRWYPERRTRERMLEGCNPRGWVSYNYLKENCGGDGQLSEATINSYFVNIDQRMYYRMEGGKVYKYDVDKKNIAGSAVGTVAADNIDYFDGSFGILPSLILISLVMILLI